MPKPKKQSPLFRLVTNRPIAGAGEIRTKREWARVFGYDLAFMLDGKFVEVKPEETSS